MSQVFFILFLTLQVTPTLAADRGCIIPHFTEHFSKSAHYCTDAYFKDVCVCTQVRTRDIGGEASTSEFINEVAKNLELVEPIAVKD